MKTKPIPMLVISLICTFARILGAQPPLILSTIQSAPFIT